MIDLTEIGCITDLRTEQSLTSEQIKMQIGCRITQLNELGAKQGDKFCLTHGGSIDFFLDLLAVWSIGGCALCINQHATAYEIENLVSFTQPDWIVTGRGHGRDLDRKSIQLNAEAMPTSVPEQTEHTGVSPALILFTSGSTGNPKGVVLSASAINSRLSLNCREIGSKNLLRTLCLLPTHFGHGLIGNCLTPLLNTGHLFLLPNPGIPGLSRLGETIDTHKISFMSSVPAMWKVALRASAPPEGASLKRIHIGSAPLAADLWNAVIDWSKTREVVNTYGITETANWFAGANAAHLGPQDGLVGKPFGGEFALLNESGQITKSGIGEVLIKTPSIMSNYFMRPDLTDEVIKDDWYASGDQGTVDDQGNLILLGRLKTQINRAGEKVIPEELDLLLEQHPSVREACAFGIPDPIQGETVGIAICGDADVDVQALKAWTSKRIRQHCVPDKWFVLDEIPKTDRGKVQRAKVMTHCCQGKP